MEHPRQFKFIHLLLWEILELFMVQEKIMEPINFFVSMVLLYVRNGWASAKDF